MGLGISIYSYVKRTGPLREVVVKCFLKQILEGLYYIHTHRTIHLDIKPENICILETDGIQPTIKIADFGSSKTFAERNSFGGLTCEYMAPELVQLIYKMKHLLYAMANQTWDAITEQHITGKVDVYAAALVAMFMYKGYHIFVKWITAGKTSYAGFDKTTIRSCQQNLLSTISDNPGLVKLLIPDECSPEMKELLDQMTQPLPNRFDAQSALFRIDNLQYENTSTYTEETKVDKKYDAKKKHSCAGMGEVSRDTMEIGFVDKTGEPPWSTGINGQFKATSCIAGVRVPTKPIWSPILTTITAVSTKDELKEQGQIIKDDTNGNQGNLPDFDMLDI